MAIFANDTFTEAGTGTVQLTSHTSDSGHTWLIPSGNINLVIDAAVDELATDAAIDPRIIALLDATPPSADYSAEVDTLIRDDSDFCEYGIMVRGQSDFSGYGVFVDSNVSDARLVRFDAGAVTTLGLRASFSATRPVSVNVKVQAVGSTIKLFVDGVEKDSVTDTTYTAVGNPCIFIRQQATVLSNADYRFDNFSADNLGSAPPIITDINANNEVTPGTTATLTGTNLTGATGFTIGTEAQTDFTVVSDTSITFTTVRGGNPYNQNLTGTLLHPDGNQTITVQQVPAAGELAVTAASPNTTAAGSFWTGVIDSITGDPVTIVDGDQGLAYDYEALSTAQDPFSIAPDGTITAGNTGTFKAIYWDASTGEWGPEQTVTFTDTSAPAMTSVSVPTAGTYALGNTLTFTANWNEAVNVTGVPAINLDIGGSARQANYASGSGTAATAFTYTVQSGDLDTDGVTVTSLTLDGGTIKDSAGNDADLTLNSVGDTSGVLVDGVVPTDWPFGTNIRPAADQNWVYGPRHPKTGMRVRLYK